MNHVATQEVAQVKGRSGGSAKVKVKRREPQFRGADMLQSFCENESNANENETDVFVERNVETSDTDSAEFLSWTMSLQMFLKFFRKKYVFGGSDLL